MKEKNLHFFYIHELLFQFSDSMLIIVLPVFIYRLFGSVSAVFIFILVWNLIYGSLLIPIFNLAMRWKKPKFFMALGVVFYISALTVLGMVTPENIGLIIPGTILFGLYISFYWMVRHWFFAVNSDYKKIGGQISTLTIIRILITFIAPIIGGIVSFFVSFNVTFVLGAVAGLLSLIPVLLFNAPPHPEQFSYKKIITAFSKPALKNIRPAYFWEGFSHHFINQAWILAFAIFIGNILDLGLLVGITTLITTLLTWMTGRWFDQRKRTMILTRTTLAKMISSLLYSSVFLFPYLFYVWVVELTNRFVDTMHRTVVDSYLYAYSNKIHPVHFILNREIHLTVARIISSGILAIAFYFLSEKFLWLVIAIGAFMLLAWLTLKRSDYLLDTNSQNNR